MTEPKSVGYTVFFQYATMLLLALMIAMVVFKLTGQDVAATVTAVILVCHSAATFITYLSYRNRRA